MRRLLAGRLPLLRARALRQGVFGGNRAWLAVWGVLVATRVVKRLVTPKPVVERFVLLPGEALLVTDLATSEPATAQS